MQSGLLRVVRRFAVVADPARHQRADSLGGIVGARACESSHGVAAGVTLPVPLDPIVTSKGLSEVARRDEMVCGRAAVNKRQLAVGGEPLPAEGRLHLPGRHARAPQLPPCAQFLDIGLTVGSAVVAVLVKDLEVVPPLQAKFALYHDLETSQGHVGVLARRVRQPHLPVRSYPGALTARKRCQWHAQQGQTHHAAHGPRTALVMPALHLAHLAHETRVCGRRQRCGGHQSALQVSNWTV
jgi:hypothetical protein